MQVRIAMALFAALGAAALVGAPALAQETGGGTIDFTPVLNEAVAALAAATGAALLYLAKLARDWFKARTGVQLQISDEQIREVLDKAIQYGIALVVGRIGANATLRVSNAQVAQIANYVIAAVPGALKNFGITPERLQDMIRARISAWSEGAAAAEPGSSGPVTPSAALMAEV